MAAASVISCPTKKLSAGRGSPAVFYGWRIVAVAFLAHCITIGCVFYGFGVFFHPLAEQFGWTRAEISWGFSLTSILGVVISPILGMAVDRYGPRPVQLFGAVLLGAGFLALSRIESLWHFYACMGLLVAVGSAALGPISSNTAVASWFVRRRGRALGFSTAGLSMGGVVFVPLVSFLIQSFGWRSAFVTLGLVVFLIGIPPIALWMRRSPESMGLRPDGDVLSPDEVPGRIEAELEKSMTVREAIRTAEFWRMAFAFSMTVGGLSAVLLHLVPYLIDQGMDPTRASWVLCATAGVGVIGKLGFGVLLDRFEQRKVAIGCFALQACGVALLFFVAKPGILVAYVLLYGFAMGLITTT